MTEFETARDEAADVPDNNSHDYHGEADFCQGADWAYEWCHSNIIVDDCSKLLSQAKKIKQLTQEAEVLRKEISESHTKNGALNIEANYLADALEKYSKCELTNSWKVSRKGHDCLRCNALTRYQKDKEQR